MIKIFLSSTFVDMQSERDVIHAKVYPRLQGLLARRGVEVQFCDLRWGIAGDKLRPDEVMNKIMAVCSAEIDRCKPYFVLLLGARYGTVPDEDTLRRFARRHPEIAPGALAGKSITEIEYLCADADANTRRNICICRRNDDFAKDLPEDVRQLYVDSDRSAADAFCRRAVEAHPDHLVQYSARWDEEKKCLVGLDDFADKLYEALKTQIEADIGEDTSCIEEELRRKDEMTTTMLSEQCVDSEELAALIASTRKHAMTILRGEAGSGKSCMLAKAAMSERRIANVVCLHVGDLPIRDAASVVHHVLYRYGDTAPIDDVDRAAERLSAALYARRPALLLLDEIDAMTPEERLKLLRVLPSRERIDAYACALAARADDIPEYTFVDADVAEICVQELDERQTRELIDKQLVRQSKELSAKAVDTFVQSATCTRPSYVALAVNRLTMMNKSDYDAIAALVQDNGIEGGEAHEQYLVDVIRSLPSEEAELVRLLTDKVGETYGKERVQTLLAVVAAGEEALRTEDVRTILNRMGHPTSVLDLAAIVQLLDNVLRTADGQDTIAWAHSSAIKAVDEGDLISAREAIFDYINALEEGNPARDALYFDLSMRLGYYAEAAHYLGTAFRQEHCFALFGRALADKKERRQWQNRLSSLVACADALDKQAYCTFCGNVLYGVFGAINRATQGLDEIEGHLMEDLLSLARKKNERYNGDVEVYRLYYMTIEKCAITRDNFEDKLKYCEAFYNKTEQALSRYADYEHYDYLVSDHCHAIEKYAEMQWMINAKVGIRLYDEAILLAGTKVEATTAKKDLLAYQKNSYVCMRYRAIVNMLGERKELYGWSIDEERKEYCKTIEQDLLAVVDFCDATLATFRQEEHSEVPSNYRQLGADCHFTLGLYYGYIEEDRNSFRQLVAAYDGYLDCYRRTGQPAYAYMLRCACNALAKCKICPPQACLDYMAEAFDITNEAMRRYPEAHKKQHFEMMERMNGTMLEAMLKVLYPDCDFAGSDQEIIARSYAVPENRVEDAERLVQRYFASTRYVHDARPDRQDTASQLRIAALANGVLFETMTNLMSPVYYRAKEALQQCNVLLNTRRGEGVQEAIGNVLDRLNTMFETIRLAMSKQKLWRMMKVARYLADLSRCLSGAVYYTETQPDYMPLEKCAAERNYLLALSNVIYAAEFDSIFNDNKHFKMTDYDIFECELHAYAAEAWGDARVFAFALRQNKETAERYLENRRPDDYKDWRNAYWAAVKTKDKDLVADIDTVGKFLADNFAKPNVKRLLYRSNFYALAAAEHAYRTGRNELAYNILHVGYDRYLEIGTLYLMRKYDRRRYKAEFADLKLICLVRIDYQLRRDPRAIGRFYGTAFGKELQELVKDARKALHSAAPDDPRLVEERRIPKWAQ